MLTANRRKPVLFVLCRKGAIALFLIAVYGSAGVVLAQETEHPSALIVYPKASNVSYDKVGLTDRIWYHVEAKFPASSVIGFIASSLRKTGWKPLGYDFMNPDLDPSISDAKWVEIIDGSRTPNLCVQQWMSQWKDSSGNIVEYVFRYRSPVHDRPPACNGDTAALTGLSVDGIRWSASAVKSTIEGFEQWQKEHACSKRGGTMYCRQSEPERPRR